MRRIILVTVILCLLMVSPCPAEVKIPQIRVLGESRTCVAPDHVALRIGIKNKAHSARVAKELHKKMLETTMQILSGFHIKDQDIKVTGPYWASGNTSVSTIRATLREHTKLSALVQALSTKPGIEIEQLTYGHSRQAALMKKTQAMALVNAKQTALSMTETLNTGLGDVIFIQEQSPSVSDDDSDTSQFDICIRKRIEVVFRLELSHRR